MAYCLKAIKRDVLCMHVLCCSLSAHAGVCECATLEQNLICTCYPVRDLCELYCLLSNTTLWCGARFAALVSALEARAAQGGTADDYYWIDIFSKDQSGHGFHSITKTNYKASIRRRC